MWGQSYYWLRIIISASGWTYSHDHLKPPKLVAIIIVDSPGAEGGRRDDSDRVSRRARKRGVETGIYRIEVTVE